MAVNLTEAAHLTYLRTRARWLANTLIANTQAFINACSPFFADDRPGDRPVGNWIPMLQADIDYAATLVDPQLPLPLYNTFVEHIYRMCLTTDALENQALLSGPQAAGVLAAWNAHIGP